jgi:hypothetical protein
LLPRISRFPQRRWLSLGRSSRSFGNSIRANFELIDKTTEIVPGITLIALVSEAPGTRELKELSLAIIAFFRVNF